MDHVARKSEVQKCVTTMHDDRQIRLEELLARQQQLLDALNGVVIEQRQGLDQLSLTVAQLEAKVKLLAKYVEHTGDALPHEKPPHY